MIFRFVINTGNAFFELPLESYFEEIDSSFSDKRLPLFSRDLSCRGNDYLAQWKTAILQVNREKDCVNFFRLFEEFPFLGVMKKMGYV